MVSTLREVARRMLSLTSIGSMSDLPDRDENADLEIPSVSRVRRFGCGFVGIVCVVAGVLAVDAAADGGG